MLTGLQPTGYLTLGNYVGAIGQMIKNQDEYESYIFVADMHAITVPKDPNELRNNIKSLLAIYLACGIDPKKNTIFLQSENVYHANVSWILECLTPYGELGRMTQFKDKSRKSENFSAGLLTYPVLMASDILLYDIDVVPVGQDQKQHVELTRNIAERVNKKYNTEIFKVPEPLIQKTGAKIMSLQEPTKKMSKSDVLEKASIFILDEPNLIRKKIASAVTDCDGVIKYDVENKPGISNLLTIYSCCKNISIEDAVKEVEGLNYGEFKKLVGDSVVDILSPIQTKYHELINNPKYLDEVLDKGAEKASYFANKMVAKVKRKIGVGRKK